MNFIKLLSIPTVLLTSFAAPGAESNAPYPRSEVFSGLTFHRETQQRLAEGSDIWNCTWAADGNLYATWGDGGGFGGTDSKGRASLGVASIRGIPPEWQGINVWGGVDPLSPQPPTIGKASIIAVGDAIYLFASEQGVWNRARLWKSAAHGRTWLDRGWIFPKSHKVFAFPGLVQFGQGNRLSPEGYVYGFSDNDPQRVHDNNLYLVPGQGPTDREPRRLRVLLGHRAITAMVAETRRSETRLHQPGWD